MKTIPYGHQWIDGNDIKEVIRILKSDWITQGPKIKEFEDDLCGYTKARYAVAVSSGTAALHIACLAAGIKQGDEAVTSPITFIASANCIVYCGGKPVFADIEPDTINISPDELRKSVTKRTKAVIPVHFAGHPCDMERIFSIARSRGLLLIEDAAHALGAEYKGVRVGSCKYSDMTTLSFHPVKHVTTGEGGAVLTNRKDLYKILLMLRNHGITKDLGKPKKEVGAWYYEQRLLGFNYRITDFQCALGVSQLRKLNRFLEKRREIAGIYDRRLSSVDEIVLPRERPYARSAWHIYCVRLRNARKRKTVFDKLRREGIGVQVHYIPVHLQPFYRERFGYKEGDYPKAENYYDSTITLPIYPAMRPSEVKRVAEVIKKIFR